MFHICCILALTVAIATSAAVEDVTPNHKNFIPIVEYKEGKNADGSYRYRFLGGDGSFREEEATVHNAGSEDASVAVSGSYKYIDQNGHEIVVHYTADENGFVPIGANIPDSISAAARAAADLHKNEEHTIAKTHH